MTVTGNPSIVIENGHFTNNGQFQAAQSTLILQGHTTAAASVGGSAVTTFYNLEVQRPEAGAILNADINVANELRMNGGLLELNLHQADLQFTGNIINENEQNRITGLNGGSVKRSVLLNAPMQTNPGNIGMSISSLANMGLTTIIRQHIPGTDGARRSIARSYQVSVENNVDLNATIRMQFFVAELNGLSEDELSQWNSNDQSNWTDSNRDALSTTGKWVEKSGYQSFENYYTLGGIIGQPLPLDLIWFTAKEQNNKVLLDWELAKNNLAVGNIQVERSATAANGSFQAIATLQEQEGGQLKFHYTDEKPLSGAGFYRLKLTGADGSMVYSPIRRVLTKEQTAVQVYPMPVRDQLNMNLPATEAAPLEVTVYNTSGQKVAGQHFELRNGMNTFAMNLMQLPQGVYFLKFSQPAYQDVKIIKQ